MLGAKVILTPAAERGSGMVRKAEELAKKHGWFLARQFENPANPEYHRNTTGPEILRDFAGKRLDYWVTGWGTGGTLTGAGRDDQEGAARREDHRHRARGRALLPASECKPHKIQGWTPDFVPAVLDRDGLRRDRAGHRRRGDRDAARALAAKEGIFCGISSGGTFAAALKVAEKAPKGSVILAMLPDTGERYDGAVRGRSATPRTPSPEPYPSVQRFFTAQACPIPSGYLRAAGPVVLVRLASIARSWWIIADRSL